MEDCCNAQLSITDGKGLQGAEVPTKHGFLKSVCSCPLILSFAAKNEAVSVPLLRNHFREALYTVWTSMFQEAQGNNPVQKKATAIIMCWMAASSNWLTQLQARLTVGTNCCVMKGSQAVAICHVNASVVLQQ
eukprot:s3994_g1.t1